MRLINTTTLELEDHLDVIPPYAILSHTWGEEETTLQDWLNPAPRDHLLSLLDKLASKDFVRGNAQKSPWLDQHDAADIASGSHEWQGHTRVKSPLGSFGYWKILNACLLARKDGLGYLWADTNCIDKTSSAELSEAINSMYAWYRSSSVCYAYLSDVIIPDSATYTVTRLATRQPTVDISDDCQLLDSFRKSRWFRRGWTLQELLAPKEVRFYSRDWTCIGTKRGLAPLVTDITRVDKKYLLYAEDIRSASIAQRMAAVADRITTRPEDIAYCMLGLFNVSMPLLYGEGAMAFVRLQEEIMKVSDDHSIFAWTWIAELTGKSRSSIGTLATPHSRFQLDFKPGFPANRLGHLLSSRMRRDVIRPALLAIDPVCFFEAANVPTFQPPGSLGVFTMTNVGLSISLPVFRHLDDKSLFAVIDARDNIKSRTRTVTMIQLARHFPYNDRWTRVPFPAAPVTVVLGNRSTAAPKPETLQICRSIQLSSFYYNSFGGTSHRFGFWLLFPQDQEQTQLPFRLSHGYVVGNGTYNQYGAFFDPKQDLHHQVAASVLIFRAQDRLGVWGAKVILLFLGLAMKMTKPSGDFRKASCRCRISIHGSLPTNGRQLLDNFVAQIQKHNDEDSDAEVHQASESYMDVNYQKDVLHASAECLNDLPLSHSRQSQITMTEVRLWGSRK